MGQSLSQPKVSAEVTQRIEHLLKLAEPEGLSPEQARLARAVRVLEYMETPEAQKLLEALAKNESNLQIALEAQRAPERISGRKK